MLANDSQYLDSAPSIIKKCTHDVNTFYSDYKMTCNATINSIENNLKNIHISKNKLKELNLTYYDDTDNSFAMFSTL